jgi:hypothetical protein
MGIVWPLGFGGLHDNGVVVHTQEQRAARHLRIVRD